jgi:3-dehydroquinate dehydratase-2
VSPPAARRRKGPRILAVHGPNLNLLGRRDTDIYGKSTLAEINAALRAEAKKLGAEVTVFQSNAEGTILDRLHAAIGKFDGLLINPAGLTHTSVSLRDAIEALGFPAVEVHLSNIHRREAFRHTSFVSPVCVGTIAGFGLDSYLLGLAALVRRIRAAA